jgi:hypothetical protein
MYTKLQYEIQTQVNQSVQNSITAIQTTTQSMKIQINPTSQQQHQMCVQYKTQFHQYTTQSMKYNHNIKCVLNQYITTTLSKCVCSTFSDERDVGERAAALRAEQGGVLGQFAHATDLIHGVVLFGGGRELVVFAAPGERVVIIFQRTVFVITVKKLMR